MTLLNCKMNFPAPLEYVLEPFAIDRLGGFIASLYSRLKPGAIDVEPLRGLGYSLNSVYESIDNLNRAA